MHFLLAFSIAKDLNHQILSYKCYHNCEKDRIEQNSIVLRDIEFFKFFRRQSIHLFVRQCKMWGRTRYIYFFFF